MYIKLQREDTYIPKWMGNRKLKEDEQIKVSYSFMTAEQEEKFTQIKPVYKGNSPSEMKEMELEILTHANEIWDNCVKKVEGLIDTDTKKPISDPKAVRNIPGIYGLITEVVAEIKKGLEALDQKN